jgi:hypothetical protein
MLGKLPVNNVSSANGPVSVSQDAQYISLVAGVHIYPAKLFNLDNRFFIHRNYGASSWSRFSIFLGTGIPNPLQNYFTGISEDIVPGLKIHAGIHWEWYTKYNIINNQVSDQASALRNGGYYAGLNLEPTGIISTLIGLFK